LLIEHFPSRLETVFSCEAQGSFHILDDASSVIMCCVFILVLSAVDSHRIAIEEQYLHIACNCYVYIVSCWLSLTSTPLVEWRTLTYPMLKCHKTPKVAIIMILIHKASKYLYDLNYE